MVGILRKARIVVYYAEHLAFISSSRGFSYEGSLRQHCVVIYAYYTCATFQQLNKYAVSVNAKMGKHIMGELPSFNKSYPTNLTTKLLTLFTSRAK